MLTPYEWIEEGKGYREMLVPSEVLNRYPVRRTDTEGDAYTPSDLVWAEWNALDGSVPSPVKTIARKLGMGTGHVARVAYSPGRFDEWDDSQEPPLADG